jgi:hypothetical protein
MVIAKKTAQLKAVEAKYPVLDIDLMADEDFDLMISLDQSLDQLRNMYPDTDFEFERNLDLSGAINIGGGVAGSNGSLESTRFVTHMFKNGHITTIHSGIYGISHKAPMDFWGW